MQELNIYFDEFVQDLLHVRRDNGGKATYYMCTTLFKLSHLKVVITFCQLTHIF